LQELEASESKRPGFDPSVFESRIERMGAFESALSKDELTKQTKKARSVFGPVMSIEIKHESLILAQNERWRRA
jgi:hypothetical protein